MTSTKTAKPNKALRALMEQHPEQTKTILDGYPPTIIQYLNAWANVYAASLKFLEFIEEERSKRT